MSEERMVSLAAAVELAWKIGLKVQTNEEGHVAIGKVQKALDEFKPEWDTAIEIQADRITALEAAAREVCDDYDDGGIHAAKIKRLRELCGREATDELHGPCGLCGKPLAEHGADGRCERGEAPMT